MFGSKYSCYVDFFTRDSTAALTVMLMLTLNNIESRVYEGEFPLHTSSLGTEFNCKKLGTLLDLCVSSLRRGHANLLCIVPVLSDDPRGESGKSCTRSADIVQAQ